MKSRIICIGLALAALFFTQSAPATITVVGWWHLGEGATPQTGVGPTTNNISFRSAFSAGPNQPLVPPVLSPEAVGGPLGTNSGTNFSFSTSSVRFGLNATQTTYWNTTTNPPVSNYGLEIWFLPQNKGVVGGSTTWVFSTGGSDVNVPGSPWGGETVRLKDNGDGTSSLQAGMIFTNNSTGVIDFGPPVLVDTTRWIHLALINKDGVTGFYTNGVLVGTNDTGVSFPAAGVMFIGTDGDNQSIDGFVDEERLFTFASGQFTTNDLLLRPLPSIVVQPATNTTVWNGGAFSVNTLGSQDAGNTYQWQRGAGTNILGATDPILYLPQVATSDSGSVFLCVVSNVASGLAQTSSNATLTIAPVQTNNVNAYRGAVTGEPSLVAFFPMDGSTDGTVSNIVDNTRNGILELNAKYDSRTNRSFGERALSLNGDGDVQIPNNPAYEFGGGNGTVEALVYLTTPVVPGFLVPNNATIFSVASSDGSTIRYQLLVSPDGNTLVYTNDSLTNQITWAVPTSLLNRFAHVAFVFDSGVNITPYVDGVSLGTKTQTSFGSTTGVPAWIGSVTTNNPGIWTGNIDELAVYSSALSANTIAIHNSKFVFGTNTSAPTIVSQPVSSTLLAGGSPVLQVTATGTPPLAYQWKTNGTPISGATNSTLTLSHTTTNSSATYSVSVSNPIGPTNSAPIVLTFVTPPDAYATKIMGDNPTAYWRLDESSGTTMFDSAGVLNGTYSGTFTLGAPGAIKTIADTALAVTNGGRGTVPFTGILNPSGPFTIELWANPTTVTGASISPLASQFRSGAARNGIAFYENFAAAGLWNIDIGNGAGVQIRIIDPVPAVANTWVHLAAVYDGVSTATFYVDGESQGSGSGPFLPNPSTPFTIGVRSDGGVPFPGTIDEVVFYNYALTQAQIQSHVDIGLPLMTSITPATNVVTDSKPAGAPFDGLLLNSGATWAASVSDGVTTRNGVETLTNTPGNEISVLGYTNFDTPQGTIMLWMKSTGAGGGGNEAAILFDRRPGGGAGGIVLNQQDSTRAIPGSLVIQGGNNIPSLATPTSVSDNLWHHIAFTYDQSLTGFAALYIDGTLSVSNANVAAWSWTPGATLEFGADRLYDGGYWRNYNGSLDDVRIYNRILTPAEINSVFTSDALVDTNALTLQYNFNGPPNGWNINWTYGTLQSAPVVTGPYGNVSTLVNGPFPVGTHVGGTQGYFRAIQ